MQNEQLLGQAELLELGLQVHFAQAQVPPAAAQALQVFLVQFVEVVAEAVIKAGRLQTAQADVVSQGDVALASVVHRLQAQVAARGQETGHSLEPAAGGAVGRVAEVAAVHAVLAALAHLEQAGVVGAQPE